MSHQFEKIKVRLESLIEYLQSVEGVILDDDTELRPPADEQTIREALEVAKRGEIVIPQDFIDFYRVMNGFTLIWQLQCFEDLELDYIGRINIVPIGTFVEDPENKLYFSDSPDSFYKEDFDMNRYDLRKMRIFDAFVEEAETLVYFPEKNSDKYQFVFHLSDEGEVYPKNITLLEYLDWAITTKGFWFWIEGLEEEFNSFEQFIDDWLPNNEMFSEIEDDERCRNLLLEILNHKNK